MSAQGVNGEIMNCHLIQQSPWKILIIITVQIHLITDTLLHIVILKYLYAVIIKTSTYFMKK
jgi:hypothetical protein